MKILRLSIFIACRQEMITKLHSRSIDIARRSANIAIKKCDCLPSKKYCYWAFWLLAVLALLLSCIPRALILLGGVLEILLLSICIACRSWKKRLRILIACRRTVIAKLHSKNIDIARRFGNIVVEHLYCLPSWAYSYWAFVLLAVRKWLLSCIPKALILLGVLAILRLSMFIACRPENIAIEHLYCVPSGNYY